MQFYAISNHSVDSHLFSLHPCHPVIAMIGRCYARCLLWLFACGMHRVGSSNVGHNSTGHITHSHSTRKDVVSPVNDLDDTGKTIVYRLAIACCWRCSSIECASSRVLRCGCGAAGAGREDSMADGHPEKKNQWMGQCGRVLLSQFHPLAESPFSIYSD